MPKFVIERTVTRAGDLSARELREMAGKSCRVLRDLGPNVQWIQSYVTDNKLFCVYIAPNADAIREHGLRGSFPVDAVHEVRSIIDPTTAE